MGRDFVALSVVEAGSLPPGDGERAWTCRQGRTHTTNRPPTRPPSRCRLGSSDEAAISGRRSTPSSRSNPSGCESKSRTSAAVERTGAPKRRPPSGRRKSCAPGSPNCRPGGTSSPRTRQKKTPDLPALVDDPLFAETPPLSADPPADHGYPAGVIALFLGLVRLGVSLRAASRVLDLIARTFGLPFS